MTNNAVERGNGRIVLMACEACGETMNPHAEKPVAPLTLMEVETVNPAIGMLLEEIHQCPRCGRVQSRRG